MAGDKGNGPTLTAAIRRVLDGDVDPYGTIYDIIDKPLRDYIRLTYGRLDDDFRNEVATRTHTFVFEHLAQYNPGCATIQTWAKLSSRNVALKVMTERFTLHKVETESGKWERESIPIAISCRWRTQTLSSILSIPYSPSPLDTLPCFPCGLCHAF